MAVAGAVIRVSIELLPGGDERAATILNTLTIVNVGGTPEYGSYRYTLRGSDGVLPLRAGYINGWPRLKRDAPALVAEALRLVYGEGR